MRIAAGGSNPIGIVKKYSNSNWTHKFHKHIRCVFARIEKLFLSTKTLPHGTIKKLIHEDPYIKELFDKFAKSNASETKSYFAADYCQQDNSPATLANPPPFKFIAIPVFLLFIILSNFIPSYSQPTSKFNLVQSMYEGDTTIVHNIIADNIKAKLYFRAIHRFPQIGEVDNLRYEVSVADSQKIVQLFPDGSQYTSTIISKGLELKALDENNLYQKIILESGRDAVFVKKNRIQEKYSHISIKSDGNKVYTISFSASFAPLNEMSVENIPDLADLDVSIGIEKDIKIKTESEPEHLVKGSVLRVNVNRDLKGKSMHVYSVKGGLKVFPKELVMEVNYSISDKKHPIWYNQGNGVFIPEHGNQNGGTNQVFLGDGDDAFAFSNPASNAYNLTFSKDYRMLCIRGPPRAYDQFYSVALTWPGWDQSVTPAIPKEGPISQIDTTVGFYDLTAGYKSGSGYYCEIKGTYKNSLLDANNYYWYIASEDSMGFQKWDNSKHLPTISVYKLIYPYAKDSTNYYFDDIAPHLIAVSFTPNDTLIDINSSFTFTFSEKMKLAQKNFKLSENGTGIWTPMTKVNDSTYSIKSEFPLIYKTYYDLLVTGAADSAGNVMPDTSFSFTTKPDPTSVVDDISSSTLKVFSLGDEIFIKSDVPYKQVKLYDMMGRVVHSESNQDGDTHSEIPIGTLPSGLYMLKVGNERAVKILKY